MSTIDERAELSQVVKEFGQLERDYNYNISYNMLWINLAKQELENNPDITDKERKYLEDKTEELMEINEELDRDYIEKYAEYAKKLPKDFAIKRVIKM